MAPPSWAYQTVYFHPSPPQDLICGICRYVFCEPVEGPCRHIYCSACIKPWVDKHRNCPLCCVQMIAGQLQPVNRAIKNMINGLAMRCKNSESGCKMQLTHETTEGHTLLCQFESEKCSNGCGKSLLRKDMSEHKAKDCPSRRIECAQCGLTVSGSLAGHNCIRMLRQIMEEQQKAWKEEYAELKSNVAELQKRLDDGNQGISNLFTDTSRFDHRHHPYRQHQNYRYNNNNVPDFQNSCSKFIAELQSFYKNVYKGF